VAILEFDEAANKISICLMFSYVPNARPLKRRIRLIRREIVIAEIPNSAFQKENQYEYDCG
jgi:hypothetical protein